MGELGDAGLHFGGGLLHLGVGHPLHGGLDQQKIDAEAKQQQGAEHDAEGPCQHHTQERVAGGNQSHMQTFAD